MHQQLTYIEGVIGSAEDWHHVNVCVLYISSDPCNLRTAYDHHRCTVVRSEKFDVKIGRCNWKRYLHLKMYPAPNIHRCRGIIDTCLDE
jgi:hypothetical protein